MILTILLMGIMFTVRLERNGLRKADTLVASQFSLKVV